MTATTRIEIRGLLAAIFLTLGIWTLGAGTAGAQTPWSEVEAAAAKAGVVTIYHNFTPPGDEAVLAAFRKSYPKLKVEAVRLASAAMIQRFNAESTAGNCPATTHR